MTIIGRSVRRLEPGGGGTQVFGEPYETADGSTVITVTRVGGGPFRPSPLGIFVIHDGKVSWEAAVDSTRLGLLAEFIGLAAAVIATLTLFRRPPWPDLSVAGLAAMQKFKSGSK
ncbi:hypothetical protein F3087_38440 [Nocardia colli]|uniref:Uncharacterized protein n=1 Tax=Nocardia colli TaxID=2545717 RepID=A0A5N0E0Y9_9NOCA|nr:hypothetical protein [Nocardia colli]KAA8883077.1 hypothetical protein F3087_38440 [Nocardia colli]